VYNRVALEVMKSNEIEVNNLYAYVLPRMHQLQKPSNVHFTSEGSQKIASQVIGFILRNLD